MLTGADSPMWDLDFGLFVIDASGAGGSLSTGSLSANAMRRISSNSLSDGSSLTSLRPN